MKDVVFIDNSLDELRRFPIAARREAGYQIDRVQSGADPADWKPIKTIGVGVQEIRIHEQGEHRVVYIAKFSEAVYVLHAFPKKTSQTAKKNIDLARKRYQALVTERKRR